MTVEQLLIEVISQAPNLLVALVVLYWQRQTIDKLLDHQRSLIDKLMQMVDAREYERIEAQSRSIHPPKIPE